MRKRFLFFAAGTLTVLAINGAIRIKVDLISVLVDGEVFQPRDAKDNDVDSLYHNDTTYAPLRVLAEAYELKISYTLGYIVTVSKQSYADAGLHRGHRLCRF